MPKMLCKTVSKVIVAQEKNTMVIKEDENTNIRKRLANVFEIRNCVGKKEKNCFLLIIYLFFYIL